MNYADRVRAMMASGKPKGRVVPGPKNTKGDNVSVPTASGGDVPMQSGEYVIPRPAVNKLGKKNLDQLVMHALGTLEVPSGSPQKGFYYGGYFNEQDAVDPSPNFWNASFHNFGGGGPGGPGGNRSGIVNVNAGDYNRFRLNDMFGTRTGNWLGGELNRNPWMNPNWFGGAPTQYQPSWYTPGFTQGPTAIPSFFDSQGYPYAQPVTGDYNTQGGSRHMGVRKNQ